jgi:hypothetical protein
MGHSFPNFRKNSNSDYQKSSLTLFLDIRNRQSKGDSGRSCRRATERLIMEPSNWAPAHSEALREYWARGMSYSEIADAINAKFGTCYSRNATIGRGKRMGLGTPDRPDHRAVAQPRRQQPKPSKKRAKKMRERRAAELQEPTPARERAEPVKHRCVGLSPRLVSLVDLENGECRCPLWRRQGGRSHPVLRPSAARRLKLLQAAFSSDARQRLLSGARGRPGGAAAGGRRLTGAALDFFSFAQEVTCREPNETGPIG